MQSSLQNHLVEVLYTGTANRHERCRARLRTRIRSRRCRLLFDGRDLQDGAELVAESLSDSRVTQGSNETIQFVLHFD